VYIIYKCSYIYHVPQDVVRRGGPLALWPLGNYCSPSHNRRTPCSLDWWHLNYLSFLWMLYQVLDAAIEMKMDSYKL